MHDGIGGGWTMNVLSNGAQFMRASRSRKSMKNGSVLFFFKTLADDVNF